MDLNKIIESSNIEITDQLRRLLFILLKYHLFNILNNLVSPIELNCFMIKGNLIEEAYERHDNKKHSISEIL